MSNFRFHRVAAFAVLAVSAAWVATGEFASVGSATDETAAASTTLAAQNAEASDAPKHTVAVKSPAFIDHNRIVRISGVTKADKKTTLATRMAGVIAELKVSKGDWVKSGDVVLTLDGPEKIAAVETAKALLKQRENEAANLEKLISRGISPKTQANDAQSALAAARSQLETAQAELDRLQVRSPFSGVIDSVSVEEGSWAPAGQAVADLLSLDPIVAAGEISERERSLIKAGGEAEIALINGRDVKGQVRFVSREATSETRTYPIEVTVDNSDYTIPAGMTAEIRLKSDPVKAVRLPRSVVTLDEDGNIGVRVVDEDHKIAFVPIDLIDDTSDGLILGGIPDGSRIVVAGQDLVTDGELVDVVDADAEGSALTTGAVE
ncbi:efflux RND transporter periplasmic adaptor subunit [Pseudohoeflea suaedae]|uniref:Efflux RND transporter periplasmic adaptor subunit n=1 Tax=Pseudohoeflea suaedae TaxID=877384 RepID=A0A4R5PKJ7_9HYPH|nr:efflux RND transporter periplasmic adaptor subunit [Pseudohoeflea suaedae]TDH35828.1 efflux RND transporter periplasmic adaptor subunit [Pseudohoeflea suaedae]